MALPVGVSANPPSAVSLYLTSILCPTSPMASTHSSTGITGLTSASAICAEAFAMAAALAFLTTHGISTRPATGSHTKPNMH